MPLIDLPTKQQYDFEAFLLIGSALKLVFDVVKSKSEAIDAGISIDDDVDTKAYEAACQHQLKNALVFAQQAYEMYLRGVVCEISPYLLVPDQQGWIKKAGSGDVRFSEVRSVQAAELPNLINAVSKDRLEDATISIFGKLRELRNRLVHATAEIKIARQQLLHQISHLVKLMGYPNCIIAFVNYEARSHSSILFDLYEEQGNETNQAQDILRAARLEFGISFADEVLLGLEYVADGVCPECFLNFDQNYGTISNFQKTAVVTPEYLLCGVCGSKSDMVRLPNNHTAIYSLRDRRQVIFINSSGEFHNGNVDDCISLYKSRFN